jgi:iron complex transport system ATP-binding protein
MKQRELASAVSYVPQSDSRYLPFTVEEFVLTGRYPHLSPFTAVSRKDREMVREALERTGTAKFSSRRMNSLSGGERQLVMIAASLAQGAGIMLLDEPAAFLDPGHQLKVISLLKEIHAAEGVSIVMVTHDINRAILSGGSVLVLHAGRVEYSGPSGGLARSGILEKVYGREFEYMKHPNGGYDIIMPDVIDNDGQR